MMIYIHYHQQTGRIGAWGTAASATSHLPNHIVAVIDSEIIIDPRHHRIVDGELWDVPADELADWNCPTIDQVAAYAEIELIATDCFMMPDRDVDREPWIAYRRALRDLSRLDDAAAQLAAWPARPDGKENRP